MDVLKTDFSLGHVEKLDVLIINIRFLHISASRTGPERPSSQPIFVYLYSM